MKTVISIALALLILAGLSACTQNNGHIGKRFGMWKLIRIDIDGKTDTEYKGNIFWCFQTGVIEMKESNGEYVVASSFGKCSEVDGNLILDYINHDNEHMQGSGYYSPLPATHLPAEKVLTLSILKLDRTEMKLLYHGDDDKAYIYTLKKWG